MRNPVNLQCWIRLPAPFLLLALGFLHANITEAQSLEYRLGPGDRMEVNVFGREDLSGIYTVRNSGSLSLPIAGEIKASDLTVEQLEAKIENRYSVLMKNERGPDQAINVNIEIVEHRPFYIIGDVSRPGNYEYRPGLTVLRAIAIAGGYVSSDPNVRVYETSARSDSAKEKERARVRITRETDQDTVSFAVADDAVVLPGDVISVPYQGSDASLSLPYRRQQSESMDAAPVGKDAVSKTETGTVTESVAIPATEDPISDFVYSVYLFSSTSAEVADKVNQEFRQAGLESTVEVGISSDVKRYRVAVTGFESRQAAEQYVESINGTLDVDGIWIGRNRRGN